MMLSRGLAASPALQTGNRKQDAGAAGANDNKNANAGGEGGENILQERMQHMIDLQNAYTESFQDEDGTAAMKTKDASKDIGATNEEKRGLLSTNNTLPRGGSLAANYQGATMEQAATSPSLDPTVGKGKIIFPNSYQQQPIGGGGLDGNDFSGTITTLEQHIAHQEQQAIEQQQQLYYGAAPEVLIEPPYFDSDLNPNSKDEPCCCLWAPFTNWIYSLLDAENLHRSFCYGAIDGMLTGAGLVATLGGFGFFSVKADGGVVPVWLVAVTWVACTADAICMALGHVWSTHVLSSHAANERRDERLAFAVNRNESKAKLVDLLLSRGMLKIDAMSIADTLEGYPDIFVGALVGDAVVLQGGEPSLDGNAPAGSNDSINARGFSDGYRSYGQFNELEHDPDAAAVIVAVSESRTEGVVMMIAFSIFGSLPSIIYYFSSCLLTVPVAATVASASNLTHHNSTFDDSIEDTHQQQVVSARSAAMTVTCAVMWCLGMWKSKFFDSNWVLFGIETVVVLMVCVLSAYALGCGLGEVVSIPVIGLVMGGDDDDEFEL